MADPWMTETWLVTLALAAGTFAIRLGGVAIGQRLPQRGAWARMLAALPGCLIVALLAVLLLKGSTQEWSAGAFALLAAIMTRNLPITMLAGIVAISLLRYAG